MEATGGFEPPNRAFAELRLNHLATSPRRYIITFMVPRRRFELLRAYAHCPLKTACLPIPPPRHIYPCFSRVQDFVLWQEWEDSNPRPAVLETAALAN